MKHLFIYDAFCYLTRFYLLFQRVGHKIIIKIIGDRHLDIKLGFRCLLRIMDSTPVRDHNAIIAPFLTQDLP